MARYRVGDKYLSEEEYQKHQDFWAAVICFCLGTVIAGYLAHAFSVEQGWEKSIRFTAVIVAGLAGGGVLAYLRNAAGIIFGFAVLAGVISGMGYLIWILV